MRAEKPSVREEKRNCISKVTRRSGIRVALSSMYERENHKERRKEPQKKKEPQKRKKKRTRTTKREWGSARGEEGKRKKDEGSDRQFPLARKKWRIKDENISWRFQCGNVTTSHSSFKGQNSCRDDVAPCHVTSHEFLTVCVRSSQVQGFGCARNQTRTTAPATSCPTRVSR